MTQQLRDEQPAIAAAIIVDDGRVLLVRRRQKEDTLLWAFPSGAVEPGETAEQAAAREVREEVGLEVRPARTLGARVHPATGRKMIYVVCDLVDGKATVLAEDELAELAWVERHHLTDYVPHGFFPAVQRHLDAVLSAQPNGTSADGRARGA